MDAGTDIEAAETCAIDALDDLADTTQQRERARELAATEVACPAISADCRRVRAGGAGGRSRPTPGRRARRRWRVTPDAAPSTLAVLLSLATAMLAVAIIWFGHPAAP